MTFFDCYLAAPWFKPEQLLRLQRVECVLEDRHEMLVYSPRKILDLGSCSGSRLGHLIFCTNLMAIQHSKFVLAITNGKDMGTLWECGYAFAIGKPIIYYAENLEGKFNVMLAESGFRVITNIDDLSSELDIPEVYGGRLE